MIEEALSVKCQALSRASRAGGRPRPLTSNFRQVVGGTSRTNKPNLAGRPPRPAASGLRGPVVQTNPIPPGRAGARRTNKPNSPLPDGQARPWLEPIAPNKANFSIADCRFWIADWAQTWGRRPFPGHRARSRSYKQTQFGQARLRSAESSMQNKANPAGWPSVPNKPNFGRVKCWPGSVSHVRNNGYERIDERCRREQTKPIRRPAAPPWASVAQNEPNPAGRLIVRNKANSGQLGRELVLSLPKERPSHEETIVRNKAKLGRGGVSGTRRMGRSLLCETKPIRDHQADPMDPAPARVYRPHLSRPASVLPSGWLGAPRIKKASFLAGRRADTEDSKCPPALVCGKMHL
jgi:hypothetical protein